MRTSPFLRNAEASLSAQTSKCSTFERKDRNWTLKRTLFARNVLFNGALIMRANHAMTDMMYFFFTLLFLYIYLYVNFFHISLLIMTAVKSSKRQVTFLSLIFLLKLSSYCYFNEIWVLCKNLDSLKLSEGYFWWKKVEKEFGNDSNINYRIRYLFRT